jgi:beta-lactamase superfamily II metal-dependent hydrolase
VDLNVPQADELEISLFGPGVGECVVVHLGRGEWMVVDSCRDPDDRQPAALKYLTQLGVNVASQVKAIVVTHWHDDHVDGVDELFAACVNATLVCSQALRGKEFIDFVNMDRPPAVEETGVSTFRRLLELLKQRQAALPMKARGPVWASADRTLLNQAAASNLPAYNVVALSPSDAAITLSLNEINEEIERSHVNLAPKRRAVARQPNEAAVVLQIQVGGISVLLGSDLESRPGVWDGWSAVLQTQTIKGIRSTVFKVAHHGAASGHSSKVWEDHLIVEPIAILTPFLIGSQRLPSEKDVERICSSTSQAYLTSGARWTQPPKRETAVERTIKPIASERRVRRRSFGQIRVRVATGHPGQCRVDLAGSAHRLTGSESA